MSALAGAILLAAVHGSGVYIDAGLDLGWNDRIGFVTRGERIVAEVGYFHGNFQGSYGFGDFWRFGAAMSWEPIVLRGARTDTSQTDENVFIAQFYHPHFTIARGADLFKIGFMWKLRFGPVWSTNNKKVFYDDKVIWGGAVSMEGGAYYNFAPTFSLGPRIGIGMLVDELRVGFQGTFGFGATFLIPVRGVKPKEKADYWEKDY
jgi:hypothetical protein